MDPRARTATLAELPFITPLPAVLLTAFLLPAVLASPALAQEDHHESEEPSQSAEDGHHGGLHFIHPLVADSVSPDTKVRLDHQFFGFPDGDQEHSGVLEGEYAISRSFSIEAGIPYSYTATEFGNAALLLKFANYAFEEAGVLLGYGLEFGFPTNGSPDHGKGGHQEEAASVSRSRTGHPVAASGGGSGVGATLGTDEWEVAPFLNIGWKSGPLELVGWGVFGIPFSQAEQSEVATELSYNVSAMYHVSSRVQALVELDGTGGISGPVVGEDVANLSPGLRAQILEDTPIVLGTSVGFPLASGVERDPFDVRWKTSFFWHF